MSEAIEFNPPEPEELNKLLSAYEITSLVAKGGMGAVYLATQLSLDREVAIKVLPPEFGDASFRAQFATEAKAMARLNHQNLIGIFDFGEVNDMPYIVMEYVNGKSLYYSAYQSQIEQKEAVRLIIDICHGLAHAHEAGILHRDIKPANILLSDKAEPKIGDFGLARATTEKGEDEVIYGTPGYAAPEVVNNPSEVDVQSDIYAVGVMLHELLTSELPDEKRTPPSHICGCDPRLDAIVKKATAPDAAQRYPTAEALAADLEKIKPTLRKSLIAPQLTPKHLVVPVLNGSIADNANPEAEPKPNPSSGTQHKVNSGSPVLRNIITICLLIIALFFLWNAYQKKGARINEEQAKIDREYQESLDKKKKNAQKPPPVVKKDPDTKPRYPGLEPNQNESTEEALNRLKSQLAAGDRSEFPRAAKEKDGSHYLFINKKLNWSQAARFCEEYGGQLATLHSEDALTWLSGQLSDGSIAWLGGAAVGSTWKWVDGSKWVLRQPSTSLGNHVAIADSGIIRPRTAKSELPFVIQWTDDGSNRGSLAEQLQRLRNTVRDKVPDWPPGTIGFGARRYLLVQRNMTWDAAASLAAKSSGKLAVPSDQEENYYLKEYLNNSLPADDFCWLGGKKIQNNWTWVTGEAWASADWAAGYPKNDSEKSALAYKPGKKVGWFNTSPEKSAAAFIIEWSKDGKDALPEPADGSELADLQKLAKALIAKASADYFKMIKKSAEDAIWESDVWLRGLVRSEQDAYSEGLEAMKVNLRKNPYIDENIAREGMPEKLGKIVDHYTDKQVEAKEKLTKDLDKLRGAYLTKLNEIKKSYAAAGLTSKVNRIDREISAIGQTAESFSDYFSGK